MPLLMLGGGFVIVPTVTGTPPVVDQRPIAALIPQPDYERIQRLDGTEIETTIRNIVDSFNAELLRARTKTG